MKFLKYSKHIVKNSHILNAINRKLFTELTTKTTNSNIPANLDKQTQELVEKYKIFTNSIPETVEKLKETVPEIENHYEFTEWIKTQIQNDKQEELLRKEGIVILRTKHDDILSKYGIDRHNYFKYQDRDYEVDLNYELNKDLFEKQRVVDNFVTENKEKIDKLIGFYETQFKFTKYNKFIYLIYQNNYLKTMNKIKYKLIKRFFVLPATTLLLYAINPLLPILLLPDYLQTLNTYLFTNKIIDQIIIKEDKQNILIRTFNSFGFRKEHSKISYNISKMNYLGKVSLPDLNISNNSSFFLVKLIKNNLKPSSQEKNLDSFTEFHQILYRNKYFYLPADLSNQHPDTNEDLVLAILNADLDKVLKYDYSNYEDRQQELYDLFNNYMKEYHKKSYKGEYITKEERLAKEFSKYHPNRDYADQFYDDTLKRPDDVDGSYIDNGYR